MYSLTVLEVRSPKPRCQQGHDVSEGFQDHYLLTSFQPLFSHQQPLAFLALEMCHFSLCPQFTQCSSGSVSLFSHFIRTPVIGLEPILIQYDHILTGYVCRDHFQIRYRVLGGHTFGENTIHPSTAANSPLGSICYS